MDKFLKCIFFLTALFSFFAASCFAQSSPIQKSIERIIEGKRAKIGVAIIPEEGKKSVEINGDYQYPMQSVYKFPLALAIFDMADKGKLSLDKEIYVSDEDLNPDTYSPMLKKYPRGGVYISVKELLRYAVSESDNNACDILFRIAGGAGKVNQYIVSAGINNMNIAATEGKMHRSPAAQYSNWSTPMAAARLMEKFYRGELLLESSSSLLWDMLSKTVTGPKRIKASLSEEAVVAHKTGTGIREKGVMSACNDIGIVKFPDGRHFTIAVFITDSKESDETNERIIGEIAKAAWDYYKDTGSL